jgi:RNA polymerase sigma-70 factor (ECF subfamily)
MMQAVAFTTLPVPRYPLSKSPSSRVPDPTGGDTAKAPLVSADARAFTAVYRENARQVARWATRLGGPSIDVEDVLQEVFIIAHRRLSDFRGDSQIGTWLFAITRNVVRQRMQRERVRRFFLLSASREDHQAGSRPSTPIEDMERRESIDIVYRALAGLPEKYRTAFVLFEIEGLTGQEVADLTGQKVSTLRVWLLRARAQVARRLQRIERALARERGDHHA